MSIVSHSVGNNTRINLCVFIIFFLPHMQKLLKLMPTDEERTDITNEMTAKPNIPLRPSEEFLHKLASIAAPELHAKLNLLSFNYFIQEIEEVYHCSGGFV